MTRSRLLAVAAVAASSALLACSAILGLDDTNVVAGYHRDASVDDAAADASDGAFTDATDADATDADAGCSPDGAALESDPHNCGACDHDCLGGSCVARECRPLVLAGDDAGYDLFGVTADDTDLFLTEVNTGSILRVAKDGDGGVSTVVAGEPHLWGVVAGQGNVYFTNPISADGGPGGLSRCPTAGCSGNRVEIPVESSKHPESLAIDATQLFYALGDVAGSVWSCNLPDCTGATELAATAQPYDVTLGTTTVLWNEYQNTVVSACGKGGCNGTPQTADVFLPIGYGMAADLDNLYFGDTYGDISRASIADLTKLDSIALQQETPRFFQIDGAFLYWLELGTGPAFTNGSVRRCLKTNCGSSIDTLATGLNHGFGLVQDADALYYVTRGDGLLWKLRKP